MNLKTPSWDLLGAFLAVMHTGSLSGASRSLGVAQPTVRRQVEALEEALGVVLFTRSPTGLTPTDVAIATMPYAESMAGSADALVRLVSAPTNAEGGTVRLTASEVLGAEVLPSILAELHRAHPQIQIELSATNANLDLLRRDADIAIRMVQPTQGALVAKRVGVVRLGLFASTSYLEQKAAPRKLTDLTRGHSLIGRDRDGAWLSTLASVGIKAKKQDFVLRTDNDIAQVNAIVAGLGIGVCQVALAARDGLIRVLPSVEFDLPMWVVTHEDLRGSRRVSIVFDHLVTALSEYVSPKTSRQSVTKPTRARRHV
jgi:DNA-binding transcriptional LysR family regulator